MDLGVVQHGHDRHAEGNRRGHEVGGSAVQLDRIESRPSERVSRRGMVARRDHLDAQRPEPGSSRPLDGADDNRLDPELLHALGEHLDDSSDAADVEGIREQPASQTRGSSRPAHGWRREGGTLDCGDHRKRVLEQSTGERMDVAVPDPWRGQVAHRHGDPERTGGCLSSCSG